MRFINRYSLIIILLIELICASNVKWGKDRWKEIICFDGKGYYAYLPAIFIYNDLHFSFHDSIEQKYYNARTYYEYRVQSGTGIIDKYYAGTAVAQLPFFLLGHVLTLINGGASDGYSFYYQLCISLAGIFYGFTGLFYLRKILRRYLIPENIITVVLFTIVFATQLFYYTVFDPSLSHVYSFAFITLFLYQIKLFIDDNARRNLMIAAFLLGLIIITRPINGLIIFILPFLCGTYRIFLRTVKEIFKNIPALIISILIFVFVISIQAIIYYVQSGKLYTDSYVVENFIWNRPEMINILFSYRKGLFIYTPVTFISLIGLIYLFKNSRFSFFMFILFFLLITYVFSCWWSWWYGGSFSARPFTEYLSLFAILLAFTLTSIKSRIKKIIINCMLAFCLLLCQVQTYQFRYFIIHWEKMDKEHYWRVFMRIDKLFTQQNPNADLLTN